MLRSREEAGLIKIIITDNYIERLTRRDPKLLQILQMYIFSKFSTYNTHAHIHAHIIRTHAHTHAPPPHTHTHPTPPHTHRLLLFLKRKVFKEDLKELQS